jgi:translocation and assembly module TamB
VPFLSVDCTTGEVRLRSFVVDSSRWEGFLRNDSLIVSAGRAHPRGGGELRLGGRVALNGEGGGLGTGLGFVLEEVPLAIVEPFARGLRATGGVLRGNGVVTFDKGRPRTRGSLFIDNGVFEYPGIETTIGPVRGAVSIRNDSLLLRRLTVGLGDGAVGAGGRIVLRPDSGAAVDLRLWADAPSLRLPDLARIEVREARLRLTSRGDGYLLSGRAALDDTRIVKDVWLPELIAQGERGGSARAPRPFMRKIALAVRVDLRRNLSIDVNLADLRLGGTATLSGTAADPRVNGTVEVVEGDVYYLDRRFEAVGGHLRFARSRLLNPTIALSARTDVVAVVPRSTSELPGTESYTITLTVSGPLRGPEMILTAQPPLSQADIVSVLTLGTTLGAVGTELGERVQALAANQLLGFGARKLERLLGLEEVLVTGDVAGGHVEAGPHITVTKRITRYLTLSYATAVRALDEREVSAVLRLTRFLFLVGSTDQDGTSSVDLKIRLTW